MTFWRIPLGVQWLRLLASTAGGLGSILGQGTRTPHATQGGQINSSNRASESEMGYLMIFSQVISIKNETDGGKG